MEQFLFELRVNIDRDIKPFFTLLKSFKTSKPFEGACYNCDDLDSCHNILTQSWTTLQYCTSCKSLIVQRTADVYEGRGGDYTIECYVEREVEETKLSIDDIIKNMINYNNNEK